MLSGLYRTFGLMTVALLVGCAAARAQSVAPRLALVIGNAAYAVEPLPTTVADAGLVAETLAQAGYAVTAMANADKETLAKTIALFEAEAKEAGPDATIVVYFAGRGLQLDGDNFFAPIDATIDRPGDVPVATLRLSDVVHVIEALPAKVRLFIFDLARDNPFAKQGDMPLAGGLGLMVASRGSLFAFNAAPGTVGIADTAPYGAYARALSEMIQTPGLPMTEVFRRVRLRVGELTNGAVIPWDDANIDDGEPFLAGPAPAPLPAPATLAARSPGDAFSNAVADDTFAGYDAFVRAFPTERLASRARLMLAARREALLWDAAVRADDPRAYWTYMRYYRRGPHFYDARRRLGALRAALEPPPRFDIFPFPDLPAPPPGDLALIDRPAVTFEDADWEAIPTPPVSLLPKARLAFYDDLPPPPLTLSGILPIPAPVPLPETKAPQRAFGRIVQPFVPGMGEVVAETTLEPPNASTVTVSSGSATMRTPVWQVRSTDDKDGRRVIAQSGPNAAVISRTTIIRDRGDATIVQTGPTGGVLTKSVTWTDRDGGRSTLIRNGGNQIVADIERNSRGIVVAAKTAAAPATPVIASPLKPRSLSPSAQVSPPDAVRPSTPTPPAVTAQPAPVTPQAPWSVPPRTPNPSASGNTESERPVSRPAQVPAAPAPNPPLSAPIAVGPTEATKSLPVTKSVETPAAVAPSSRTPMPVPRPRLAQPKSRTMPAKAKGRPAPQARSKPRRAR